MILYDISFSVWLTSLHLSFWTHATGWYFPTQWALRTYLVEVWQICFILRVSSDQLVLAAWSCVLQRSRPVWAQGVRMSLSKSDVCPEFRHREGMSARVPQFAFLHLTWPFSLRKRDLRSNLVKKLAQSHVPKPRQETWSQSTYQPMIMFPGHNFEFLCRYLDNVKFKEKSNHIGPFFLVYPDIITNYLDACLWVI